MNQDPGSEGGRCGPSGVAIAIMTTLWPRGWKERALGPGTDCSADLIFCSSLCVFRRVLVSVLQPHRLGRHHPLRLLRCHQRLCPAALQPGLRRGLPPGLDGHQLQQRTEVRRDRLGAAWWLVVCVMRVDGVGPCEWHPLGRLRTDQDRHTARLLPLLPRRHGQQR